MTNNRVLSYIYKTLRLLTKGEKKDKKCKIEFALNWRIFRLNFFKTDNRQDKNYGL